MKKYLSVFLSLVLLLGCLTACGGEAPAQEPEAPAPEAEADTPVADTLTAKYAYGVSYIPVPVETGYVRTTCLSGGALYFEANVAVGEESYTDQVTGESYSYEAYEDRIFRLDLETQACAELPALPELQLPEGWEGDSYVQYMVAGADDTLWLCQQTYTYRYNLPENFDETTDQQYNYYEPGENRTQLLQLDASGKLLQTIFLDEAQQALENSGLAGMYLDSAGNIYLSTWENVFLWDQAGNFLFSLDTADIGGEIRQYSADLVGAVSWGESLAFRPIDVAAKGWGEELPLPSNGYNFFPGSGDYDLYYNESGKVFGYVAETGESEKVLDWLECDIDSNALQDDNVFFLPDGRVVAMIQDRMSSEPGQPQVAVLTPMDASQLPEKTVLTLACMYLDYEVRSQIVNFNRTSQTYRIVVTDYSEFATEDDYNAGLTKLNTEILSGQLPDMMLTSQLPVRQYAAQGLLADLWQFIDADENIKREDLMLDVLNAVSIDGKLYQLPTSFSVETVAGLEQVLGDYQADWGLEAMTEAMTGLQPGATIFSETTTKDQMLTMCVARGADRFVNWEDGTCSFDSPEFIELLHFADQFAAEFDYDNYNWETDYESDFQRMKSGRQLLTQLYFSSFDDVSVYNAALDHQACFVGYPVGAAHTLQIASPVAITVGCENKDAAWAFLRTLLQEPYQSSLWGFPINRKVFDKKAEEAMTPEYATNPDGSFQLDEEGNKIEISHGGMGWGNDEMYEIYAVTQDEYDAFLALLPLCAGPDSYDQEIGKILTDEAGAFFAGEKTAEDTAKAIQSRVKIYVAEQG